MATSYPRLFPSQVPVVGTWYEECDALGIRSGNLVQGVVGGTTVPIVTANNINTILQEAGGAGWEKAQATAANYVIIRPTSGASLDLHIETGGTLAAMLVANWPVPAAGVEQLRIRNMSAIAQTFSATGYSGIVTADGNVATSGTYSIPVDMAVHITIDENGWIQVAPMGQEVSQAELDTVAAGFTNGSVQALFDSLRADAVHFLDTAFDLNTLTGTGWYNVQTATNGPVGGGWYYVFNGDHRNGITGVPNLDYSFQLAKRLDGAGVNNLLMRTQVSGVWSAWITLATTADITDGGANAYFERLRWDGATAISTTDLNNLTISGFYDGQTLTNAPNSAIGWFYIIHQRHSNLSDATWHHQTAYALGSGTGSVAGEVYVRSNSGGSWSAWTRLDNAALPVLATTTPAMNGTAAVGTGTTTARADHVHASDTSRAPVVSPDLTGTPTAPTATAGTNTIQIASTAFVKTAVDGAVVGLLDYRGAFTPAVASGAAGYPTANGSGTAGAILKGDVYAASAAGFILTEAIQPGDMVLSKIDSPGQTATNWDKLNGNVSYVPENIANLRTTLQTTPDDTHYPSEKLLSDHASRLSMALKSGFGVGGGGTLSVSAAGRVKNSARFLVISTGTGVLFNMDGHVSISIPTSGIITGVGGSAGDTATTDGVLVPAWDALYYIMPVGAGSTNASIAANFRLVNRTNTLVIPENWIMICTRNDESSIATYHFCGGHVLKQGESWDTKTSLTERFALGAPLASPVLTGTPQVSGNPKLGSNSGHAQRSFSDIAGAAMLMVPATGTAATTIATSDVAARYVKPGTASLKANAAFDIVVGSHTAGINGSTQVDFRLANATTNTPDMTVMSLKSNGDVSTPGRFSSAFNGARVGLVAVQSIPTGVLTTVNWTSETYDTNAYHDNASNNERLIAAVAGYYCIGAKVDFAGNATGSRALAYRINGGAAVVMNEMMPGGTSPISLSFSTEVYLTAGQYIDLQVWQSTGGAFNLNATSFATISFIGS